MIGGNVDWGILCVVLASSIAIYRGLIAADVPYTIITAWALGGIHRMQSNPDDSRFPIEGLSAAMALCTVVCMVFVGVGSFLALVLALLRSRRNALLHSVA